MGLGRRKRRGEINKMKKRMGKEDWKSREENRDER